MARPKNLTGVNLLCQTCSRDCKQSARAEVDCCPQYQARATPGDIEVAAAKPRHPWRTFRFGSQARPPKIES